MTPERPRTPWWKRLLRREPPALRPDQLVFDNRPPTEEEIRQVEELAEKYHWDEIGKRR